jgi:hypothetical protein
MTSQIATGLLICLCMAGWPLTRSLPVRQRLVIGAMLLAALTAAVVHEVGSPFQPSFDGAVLEDLIWQQVVVATWWLLVARLLTPDSPPRGIASG